MLNVSMLIAILFLAAAMQRSCGARAGNGVFHVGGLFNRVWVNTRPCNRLQSPTLPRPRYLFASNFLPLILSPSQQRCFNKKQAKDLDFLQQAYTHTHTLTL